MDGWWCSRSVKLASIITDNLISTGHPSLIGSQRIFQEKSTCMSLVLDVAYFTMFPPPPQYINLQKNAYTNCSLTTVSSSKKLQNQPKYISYAGTTLDAALATWQNIFVNIQRMLSFCF